MGYAAGDSNLYRYVNNQPTDAADPSGFDSVFGPPAQPSELKPTYKTPNGGPVVKVGKAAAPGPIQPWGKGLIIITNDTPRGDEFGFPRPYYEQIAGKHFGNWRQVAAYLKTLPDGSLYFLALSGHGARGGARCEKGGKNDLTAENLDPETLAIIQAKLAPSCPVYLLACDQARPQFAQNTANLAGKLNRPVYANTGDVGKFDLGSSTVTLTLNSGLFSDYSLVGNGWWMVFKPIKK
jgi:hypothetical protein